MMRRIGARLAVLATLSAFAGCTPTHQLVEPKLQPVGGMQVQPSMAWTSVKIQELEPSVSQLWTIDGMALEGLLITGGLPDGSPLGKGKSEPPPFRAHMGGEELATFVESSMMKLDIATAFRLRSVVPAKAWGADGIRMEFDMDSVGGVEHSGTATTAVVGGKLFLVLYWGTKLHHYGLYAPTVQGLIETAKLKGI